MIFPQWLSLATWRVIPAGWPKGRRLRLLLFADPHAGGPQMALSRLEEAVAAANGLKPDLIAVLGDYVADHSFVTQRVPIEEVAKALARLEAPLGVFAVMGNHDWRADPGAQRRGRGPVAYDRVLVSAGIPTLENQAVRVGGEDGVWVLGLGSQQAFRHHRVKSGIGIDDLAATLAPIDDDAPAILLAHEPDIFPEVPTRVALTVSGHTHGGQINLWGWTPVVPSRFGSRYVYGHYSEDGRDLVVSGGLGCSGLPLRFNRRPELTLVELGESLP